MAKNGIISRLFARFSKGSEGSAVKQADTHPTTSYEGQLLRGHGSAPVYKVEEGRKRWIVTEAVFLRNGFSWADVRVLPKATVDSIPSGSNIT